MQPANAPVWRRLLRAALALPPAYAGLLALFALSSVNISAVVLLTRAISYWSFLLFSGIVTFAAGLGQVFSGSAGQPKT